jgi:uncharacterized protein YcbX
VGEIVWLGRYPVKSMLGEVCNGVALDEAGVIGDRRYALIDEATGLVASAKHPRKWRALLTMAARYEPGDGRVAITLADGSTVHDDDPSVDSVLSRATGRAVRLTRTRPDGAMQERLSPFMEANAGTLTTGAVASGTVGDRFVDFAAVHVVTTATLGALARAHPRDTVDVRRFRPNIVVRMVDEAPFVENGWPGRTLSVNGRARMRVIVPTPRCAVPSLAHGAELPADSDVLRTVARLNRVPVLELGALACVGAYAAVERPGRLAVGDLVRLGA